MGTVLMQKQVRGEKVVLQHYIDFAKTGLQALAAQNEAEIAALCSGSNRKHSHITNYCMNTIAAAKRQERAKVPR
jgi:hypothetical protein